MAVKRKTAPPTAEEVERVNRQPDLEERFGERGVTAESVEGQPERSIRPKHRRSRSGLPDAQHPPGRQDRPERKP